MLGVFLVWYSLSKVPLSTILEYWESADKKWVVIGVCFGILSHLSRAYRWPFMLEPMGYRIKFLNSFMAVMSTYLINYTIPRAGEVARATILTNYEGVPFRKRLWNHCFRTHCRYASDAYHYRNSIVSSVRLYLSIFF